MGGFLDRETTSFLQIHLHKCCYSISRSFLRSSYNQLHRETPTPSIMQFCSQKIITHWKKMEKALLSDWHFLNPHCNKLKTLKTPAQIQLQQYYIYQKYPLFQPLCYHPLSPAASHKPMKPSSTTETKYLSFIAPQQPQYSQGSINMTSLDCLIHKKSHEE